MLYIGIDVHKKNLQICVLDMHGNRVANFRLLNAVESVIEYFAGVVLPAQVALEATHNWGMLFDLLRAWALR